MTARAAAQTAIGQESSAAEAKAGSIEIGRYRAEFEAIETLWLPPFSGSTWRGLIGHALRRTVCPYRVPACEGCGLRRRCVYIQLFDPSAPARATTFPGRVKPPAPFALDVTLEPGPTELRPGQQFALEFTLFGPANRKLSYWQAAMPAAGRLGLGKGRGRFRFNGLSAIPITAVTPGFQRPDAASASSGKHFQLLDEAPWRQQALTVELLTPLRVKRDGRYVTADKFEFHDLYRNLLRRLSRLAFFHGQAAQDIDFRQLSSASRETPIGRRELRWHDWSRYSSRQHAAMRMGGLIGRFDLPEQLPDPIGWHLWLGQFAHAGKGATMGLGRYRLKVEATDGGLD